MAAHETPAAQFRSRLSRSGLTLLKWDHRLAVSPGQAWRRVMRGYAPPDVLVDDTRENYLERVDAAWRALCRSKGIYDEQDRLLVTGSHPTIPWVLVQDDGVGAVAVHLCTHAGQPDFIVARTDGTYICGVSTEEEGVLLVAAGMSP